MAKSITLRRGLDIRLKGRAASTVVEVQTPSEVALLPDDYYGLVPRLLVREGDRVKVGQPVFADKNNLSVVVVSPVAGMVKAVVRGERRKILSIQISVESLSEQVEVSVNAANPLETLLASGLFAYIHRRPYDIVASPDDAPKAIFVSAFSSAPLAPDYEYVLQGRKDDFQTGVDVLSKIAKVFVGVRENSVFSDVKNAEVTAFKGAHPAGNVGVQINRVNPINKGEVVWTLNPTDVCRIGKLFSTGKLDFSEIVALVGSEVSAPGYVKTIKGTPIANIIENRLSSESCRLISGDPLSGTQTTADAYLSAMAHQITAIPSGKDTHEFLGWIAPRFSDFSANRSYATWLKKLFCPRSEYVLDDRIKGGERHMIMSGEYDSVLPMDIYPEFLIKAIIASDIDRMEALGIYEVAPEDFALCEFVDSSKLPLQSIVRQGLDFLREEMA